MNVSVPSPPFIVVPDAVAPTVMEVLVLAVPPTVIVSLVPVVVIVSPLPRLSETASLEPEKLILSCAPARTAKASLTVSPDRPVPHVSAHFGTPRHAESRVPPCRTAASKPDSGDPRFRRGGRLRL